MNVPLPARAEASFHSCLWSLMNCPKSFLSEEDSPSPFGTSTDLDNDYLDHLELKVDYDAERLEDDKRLVSKLRALLPPSRWFKTDHAVVLERKVGMQAYLDVALQLRALQYFSKLTRRVADHDGHVRAY